MNEPDGNSVNILAHESRRRRSGTHSRVGSC